MIRDATPCDIPLILSVWNPVIRHTAITFNSVEKTEGDIAALLDAKAQAGHPVLVHDGGGFATFGQFRAGSGYARTMEHTIILAPQARGRGLGRALMSAVEDRARGAGARSLFAGVSSDNPGGVAFHAACGYAAVAVLPQVGFKFGRWFDLHLMQKMLA